jgi:uncharacterized protein involved in exopolysaccharide biosynthesis
MDNEIEINLKKYILLLVSHWRIIVGGAFLAALIGFGVSSLQSVNYKSTALIVVTQPQFQLNFDPKFQTFYNITPANKAFLDLANSDAVLKEVLDQWNDRPDSIKTVDDFRKVVQAESGSDSSVIDLSVAAANPDQAAQVTNQWASILINKANEVYFGQNQLLTFLETQMSSTQSDLSKDENALVDFQARNQQAILTNQLNSLLQNQSEFLAIQRNLAYLEQNVQGLRSQLSSDPANKISTADILSSLLLQIQAYNSQINTTNVNPLNTSNVNPFPIQIQVTDQSFLGNLTIQEQTAILDNLLQSIQDRTKQVESSLNALAPQILSLQQNLEKVRVEQDQLTRTRDIAKQTYTTLAQKVDETRISQQDPSNRLQLASSALPPSQAVSRNRLRNTILAGMIGGILIVITILLLEWWRGQGTSGDQ